MLNIKSIMVCVLLCTITNELCATEHLEPTLYKRAKIALIMDDIGAKAADSKAFRLSPMITFGILPNTEFSREFSQWSYAQEREVILHMPMESLNGNVLGEGAIVSEMYPNEVVVALNNALETVPHAVGLNNHMGSKLTQLTLPMSTIMKELRQRGLFFVDSRTTRFTKAYQIAKRKGVQSAQRHVFIDHYPSNDFIEHQMDKLIELARKNGKAIGIAHPYPITIEFLSNKLKTLPRDIELITVSEYFEEDNESLIPKIAETYQNSAISTSSD